MRRIYITIAALTLTGSIFAQQPDSLLRRQLELERNFNPTLHDADKINTLPALREPTVVKANTNYSTWAGSTLPPLEIALPRPGSLMTEIPYRRKKGYISFTAGNYANLDGSFGYRLVNNEKNDLSFTFLHNSSNGEIKYAQESVPQSGEAYFTDNQGGLRYQHQAERLGVALNLNYLHTAYNYYGNRFGFDPFFNDEKQRLGVFHSRLGIVSTESDIFNYSGSVDYKHFTTAIDHPLVAEPLEGNEFQTTVSFDKPLRQNSKMGVEGTLFTAFYKGDFDNYALINASPWIMFGSINSNARLGVDLLFQAGDKTRVRVVPNLSLQLGITDHTSLYANIHGGFDHNTFLDMINESRYVLPVADVTPSYSILDIDAGIRIGDASGFRIDLFGGYKKSDDAHFLVLAGEEITGGEASGLFVEALRPIYGSLSHSHLGGLLQTNMWAPLDLTLRLQQNFYDVREMTINDNPIDDAKAYNKPGLEVDLRGTLEVMEKLKFSLNYYFAGDRWSYFEGTNHAMDHINDLNLGAVYDINDAFSLKLKVNNMMSQKYDLWYGHPAQGLNLSGGFTFAF